MTRAISLSTSSIDFGNTRMGLCNDTLHGDRAWQIVTIKNGGNDSLRIDSITSQSADITISGEMAPIAPNASEMFKVWYCPSSTGPLNTTVTISTNATDSAKKRIAVRGNGIQYIPFSGSLFTYDARQLDTAGKPIGLPETKSIGIIASDLSYHGKTGVSLTSDSTYFKIEDDGDVSIYFAGFPTYPSSAVVDSGWISLPTATKEPVLRRNTTTFTDSMGSPVNLVTTDTAMYLGDTTITVDGQQFACMGVRLSRWASYFQGSNGIVIGSFFQAAFSPSLGFTVLQGSVAGHVVVVNGRRGPVAGGGEGRILKSYILK